MTGTEPPPNEIVVEKDCIYPDGEEEDFQPGVTLSFTICFFVVLIVAIGTFLIWRRWWNV
jgi:hypothetical protein